MLVLPVLVPSWRFFDWIAPSPRIELLWLDHKGMHTSDWQKLNEKPRQLSLVTMVKRLFWNPVWNENLFMISCAERVLENSDPHRHRMLVEHVAANNHHDPKTTSFKFRLILIKRSGAHLEQELRYTSEVIPVRPSAF